jgi:hypothetical protein
MPIASISAIVRSGTMAFVPSHGGSGRSECRRTIRSHADKAVSPSELAENGYQADVVEIGPVPAYDHHDVVEKLRANFWDRLQRRGGENWFIEMRDDRELLGRDLWALMQ